MDTGGISVTPFFFLLVVLMNQRGVVVLIFLYPGCIYGPKR